MRDLSQEIRVAKAYELITISKEPGKRQAFLLENVLMVTLHFVILPYENY